MSISPLPPQTLSPNEVERLLRLIPHYRVILHNDHENYLHRTTHILTQEIGLTWQEAWCTVKEAHTLGKATVGLWAKEYAERYCWRLKMRGLDSTFEMA